MLIIFTVAVYGLGIWFLFWLYFSFGSSSLNLTILITLTAFLVIFTLAVVVKVRDDASILTNALAFLYFLFLACSAMSNSPEVASNPYVDS